MILVIGATASGKRVYVESLGYTSEQISAAVLDEKPVLDKLQDLVMQDPEKALDLLPELLKKEVVICDEVGSGVIPIDARERSMREQSGRLCILLAKEAQSVVRLVCGIAQQIKG